MNKNLRNLEHKFDVCVVGGGMSGICAAVAAARKGAKTALVHDRPVLGGNASSEIRMWICGARGDNNRETGIIDEIMMRNQYYNPHKNYFVWDSVLYDIVINEPNLTLFLNCSCMDGNCEDNTLTDITCWQLTTQTYHNIFANIFIDCSGDSILAPISGAEFRMGRESSADTNEELAVEVADNRTMGNSRLMQFRQTTSPKKYIAPSFARKINDDELMGRNPNLESPYENFWQLELGGMENTIDDAEEINHRLYCLALGMWDRIKNNPELKEKNMNYDLDFVAPIPGKRESRRYVGDYILTQNDIYAEGRFDDNIAYGGWGIDNHDPGGFDNKTQKPNVAKPSPSPNGLPYRCIYSKNIKNLMFAGRNISATHIAMSTTRVMATCSILGQAAGTAAAMAVKYGETPRDILSRIKELQQTLQDDDCYIPFLERKVNAASLGAEMISDMENAENLLNGFDRPIGDNDNGAVGDIGCFAELKFGSPVNARALRIILDNDLNYATGNTVERRVKHNMLANYPLSQEEAVVPITLVEEMKIEFSLSDGTLKTAEINNNYLRHIEVPINSEIISAKVTFTKTRGAEKVHIFSLDIL